MISRIFASYYLTPETSLVNSIEPIFVWSFETFPKLLKLNAKITNNKFKA